MHTTIRTLVLSSWIVALVASPALAQPGEPAASGDTQQLAGEIQRRIGELVTSDSDVTAIAAKRLLQRLSRSLALGPTVSVGPVYDLDAGDIDVQASLGLALLRFDIPPIPTLERIREILEGHAKKVLLENLRSAMAGGKPLDDADLDRIARETWAEIKAEFLLELSPKRFEKPSFALMAEVGHLFDADAWDVRTLIGIGVSRVYLTSGAVLHLGDDTALVVPVELSVPMLLSSGLRAPVVDLFVRADIAATSRETTPDRVVLGARFLLDIL